MNSLPTMSKRISQLIGVEGGDSEGISVTGETPQGAKRLRRLTARPPERVRLERKSTVAGRPLYVDYLSHSIQNEQFY